MGRIPRTVMSHNAGWQHVPGPDPGAPGRACLSSAAKDFRPMAARTYRETNKWLGIDPGRKFFAADNFCRASSNQEKIHGENPTHGNVP